MNKFYCANCGSEITDPRGVFMFCNNYLQIKYFDDNKSNRFCDETCACEALFGEFVERDEIPLDNDEDMDGKENEQ